MNMRLPAAAALGEQDHRSFVIHELSQKIVPGHDMFLVDAKWLSAWLDSDSDKISGEVINQRITTQNGNLRPSLREGDDYRLLTSTAWSKLLEKVEGSSPVTIKRSVIIGAHLARPEATVEVYPLSVTLLLSSDGRTHRTISISKTSTLRQLQNYVADILSIAPHKTLLVIDRDGDDDWKAAEAEERAKTLWELRFTPKTRLYGTTDKYIEPSTLKSLREKLISQLSSSLAEDIIDSVDETEPTTPDAMEVDDGDSRDSFDSMLKKNHHSLSHNAPSSIYNSYYTRSSSLQTHSTHTKGTVGLTNLGNTCFMNSALQCLSNTKSLTGYFLNGRHEPELNSLNPLGAKGELAVEYAALLKRIWETASYSVSPSRLYHTICEFAPQFGGYQQHDSQELIAFFLDGLHEDLNRVTNKPYTQNIEGDGRPDKEVAHAAWQLHLARNQSIIVDTFQGQLKSRVECPQCNHVSVTFDPFMYLSLPLASPMDDVQLVFVPRSKEAHAQRLTIRIEKNKTVKSLLQLISSRVNVNQFELVPAHVTQSGAVKIIGERSPVRQLPESDEFYVFEAHFLEKSDKAIYDVIVYNVARRQQYPNEWHRVAEPFIIRLNAYPEGFSDEDVLMERDVLTEISRLIYGRPDPELSESSSDFEVVYLSGGVHPMRSNSDRGIPPPTRLEIRWNSKVKMEKLIVVERKVVDVDPPAARRARSEGLALEECLEGFVTPETLGKENAWYCPKCKEFQQATKKFDIWKTPKILIVHLKRFVYDHHYRGKISTSVNFPLENLDLSRFVLGDNEEAAAPPRYNLFAVSDHSGGLGGGHYTAYAKNAEDGKWWYFNDTSVSPSSPKEISNSGAYLLFYERVEATPAAAKEDKMEVVPAEFSADALDKDLYNEKD